MFTENSVKAIVIPLDFDDNHVGRLAPNFKLLKSQEKNLNAYRGLMEHRVEGFGIDTIAEPAREFLAIAFDFPSGV
jgi:hypothetical protein